MNGKSAVDIECPFPVIILRREIVEALLIKYNMLGDQCAVHLAVKLFSRVNLLSERSNERPIRRVSTGLT